MKSTYFLVALILSTFLFSKTKLIAFKSHSGNSTHFSAAVSENFYDTNSSNLGVVPERYVRDARQ
ncbi:hypothetical protein HHL23_16245 [Chryseobacterium sp. RP-3-3]|uniref:Uncharacterized protein n=1 Tax=Chryseobacterium antibioticum TaxID=2728847 RepID=A0A7Y0FT47_9FLAO|nr:hypothetical protein [Chryseobacterium antibioticum]NML71341.1 hypothetical protein [Chryseobacterium antibioticum]